jgi:trk system potassium uptake protein TrkA
MVITPHAYDVFSSGDELIFIATSEAEAQIKDCFITL